MPVNESCALNPDGTLKASSEIEWLHSPSQESVQLPSMQVNGRGPTVRVLSMNPQPATPHTSNQLSSQLVISKSTKKRKAGKAGGEIKAKRVESEGLGVQRILTDGSMKSGDEPTGMGETGNAPVRKKKKVDATKDVRGGVWKPQENGSSDCLICAKTMGAPQVNFTGNVTALRQHIRRMGGDHYEVYRKYCAANSIDVHPTAVPDDIKAKSVGSHQDEQQLITDFVEVRPEGSEWDRDELLDLIMRFVVETDQSIRLIDHPAFRDLLGYQRGSKHRTNDIPHVTKLTEMIKSRAVDIKETLDRVLHDAPGKISLTFDGWTSEIMTAYLGVTAHFLTTEWELCSVLLAFKELQGRHTAENTAEVLYTIIKDFGIERKLQNLTSDNLSTNDKACRILGEILKTKDGIEFDGTAQRSHCFAHAVNLAVGAFINALSPKQSSNSGSSEEEPIIPGPVPGRLFDESDVAGEEDDEEVIEKLRQKLNKMENDSGTQSSSVQASALLLRIRAFVTKVRRCTQAKCYLRTCCKNVNCTPLELIPFCRTRWGSWHGVLGRVLELRKAITQFVNNADYEESVPKVRANQPKYCTYRLSEEEWLFVTIIHEVLQDAANVNDRFSSESEPTVWKVLPILEAFIEQWREKAGNSRYRDIKHAINAGLNTLYKYYNKTDASPAYIVSLYLEPKTKDAVFLASWSEAGQERARHVMEDIFDKYLMSSQQEEPRSSTGAMPDVTPRVETPPSLFGDDRIARARTMRAARDAKRGLDPRAELKLYLDEPLYDGNLSPMTWWKANAARYPVLAQIACDYLPVQGSSVPSERAFSSAGLDDDKRRGRISPETFGTLQFVKTYYKDLRRQEVGSKRATEEAARSAWMKTSVI